MPDGLLEDIDTETERALTRFVMNCTELSELEILLSHFNIFRILRAAHHEIRHSNMLAWLLTPDESHGLGDRFFRRWLMHVVNNADDELKRRLGLPSPIEIDALDIESVEVAREQDQVDLLIVVRAIDGESWSICIENKVRSTQHSNQLRRYREIIERRYAKSEHRLYIFLTKNEEEPQDAGFVATSYSIIENVLRNCLEERGETIGPEPRLLMRQYLALLAEDFVEDNRAAQLARKIYRSHRKAIDFILEHREDPVSEATIIMKDIVAVRAQQLGILMDLQQKGYVRFLPVEWNVPQNSGGTAWGRNSRIVLCEINFWAKQVALHIIVGRAPDAWSDIVWARAAKPPFIQKRKTRPDQYVTIYTAKSDIAVKMFDDMDPEEVKAKFTDWVLRELKREPFREAVEVVTDLLQQLPAREP